MVHGIVHQGLVELERVALDLDPDAEVGQPEVRQVRPGLVADVVALRLVLPLDAEVVEDDCPAGLQPGAEAVAAVARSRSRRWSSFALQSLMMGVHSGSTNRA